MLLNDFYFIRNHDFWINLGISVIKVESFSAVANLAGNQKQPAVVLVGWSSRLHLTSCQAK